ncbi:hypothetical protein E4U55_001576 [Claviceps digitariae]|nr:hypothetical protein E4U55_001576 [Claviceps digitariae]
MSQPDHHIRTHPPPPPPPPPPPSLPPLELDATTASVLGPAASSPSPRIRVRPAHMYELPASHRGTRHGHEDAASWGAGHASQDTQTGDANAAAAWEQQQANPWPYHGPAFGHDETGPTATIYACVRRREQDSHWQHQHDRHSELRPPSRPPAPAAQVNPSYRPYRPPGGHMHAACGRTVSPANAGAAPHHFYEPLRLVSGSAIPGGSPPPPPPPPRAEAADGAAGPGNAAEGPSTMDTMITTTASALASGGVNIHGAASSASPLLPVVPNTPQDAHVSAAAPVLPCPSPSSPQPEHESGSRTALDCGPPPPSPPPSSPPPAYSFPDVRPEPTVCQHPHLPPYSPPLVSSACPAQPVYATTSSSSSNNGKNNNNNNNIHTTPPNPSSPPPLPPRRPRPPYDGFGAGPANPASYPPPPKTNYNPHAPPALPPRPALGSSTLPNPAGLLLSTSSAKKWLDKTSHVLESTFEAVVQGPAARGYSPGQGAGQARRGPLNG